MLLVRISEGLLAEFTVRKSALLKFHFKDTHPDHVDANEDIDGIIVWDALKHAHVGIIAWLLGHVVCQGRFVHVQRALDQRERVTVSRITHNH